MNFFCCILLLMYSLSIQSNELTFSNTQNLEKKYLLLLKKEFLFFPKDWKQYIKIVPPPLLSSNQTKSEIIKLIKLQSQRTENNLVRINFERSLYGFKFYNIYYLDILTNPELKEVNKLFQFYLNDLSIITHKLKQTFNRVRPPFISKKLFSAITIPNHPSYPSAHAAQAYFISLVLSYVFPRNKSDFVNDAKKIAFNREVAGVHYRSDSNAGFEVGKQFFDYIKNHRKNELELIKLSLSRFKY